MQHFPYKIFRSGTLCPADLALLSAWIPSLTVDDESELTPSGAEEQNILGQRFRQRFPGLLDQAFQEGRYQVRRSDLDGIGVKLV